MLSTSVTRRSTFLAATLGVIAVLSLTAVAQSKTAESFAVTTTGLNPGAGQTLSIDLARMSTDAERDQLTAAFTKSGEKDWAKDLQAAPSVGYIWPDGRDIGYAIKFAQRIPAANGGERLVLVTDRPLGSWDRPAWKAVAQPTDYGFSVIELRVNRAGVGDGKASLAGKVAIDPETKGVALTDYAGAPALLKVTRRGAAPAAKPAAAAASAPAARPSTPAAAAKPAAPAPAKPAPAGK